MTSLSKQSGFTIMEMTLSLAVVGLIAGLSMPLFRSMQVTNDLDVATNAVVSSLRRSQTLSVAMEGDSTWGTKVVSGSVVTFRGTSYATRVTAYDETFAISTEIIPTGISEVVFSKLSGDPQQTGTFTLTSGTNVRTVAVNSKGTIDY